MPGLLPGTTQLAITVPIGFLLAVGLVVFILLRPRSKSRIQAATWGNVLVWWLLAGLDWALILLIPRVWFGASPAPLAWLVISICILTILLVAPPLLAAGATWLWLGWHFRGRFKASPSKGGA